MFKGRAILTAALLLLLGVAAATGDELSLETVTDTQPELQEAHVDEGLQLEIVTDEWRQLQDTGNPVFDVKYEYQMDVNPSGAISTIEQGINELQMSVQKSLNDFISRASTPPINVRGISSQQLGTPCTPTVEGYICAFVESTVNVEILNDSGGDVVSKATIDRVQAFIDDFNADNQGSVFVTFVGPFYVSTELILELSPVNDEMDETEVALLEGELFEILEPLLADDPPPSIDLETVEFLYQDLIPLTTVRRRLQGQRLPTFRNLVHIYVTGQCRGCNSDDMSKKVNDAVDANSERLRENLQQEGEENGTDYFEGVGTVGVAAASSAGPTGELPLDSAPEFNDDNDPYWVWVILGTALGMLALAFGLMFYKKRRDRMSHLGEGKAYYGDGDDVINSGMVMGMETQDTPDHPASLQNRDYQEEAEEMPPPTYVEEGGSAASRHSSGKCSGHPNSEHNVFTEDPEDGSYVFEADEIEEVYMPQQEHPTGHFRHPQPKSSFQMP